MDDLITLFVQSTYTEEAQEDIFQALGLFRVFEHLDSFSLIEQEIMMQSSQDSSTLQDRVTNYILSSQHYILDRHGVALTNETTLAFNNLVIRVLFQLQKLEDPTPVLRVIESTQPDNYKFCEIMEMFTEVPITTFLQIVETVRPIFMSLLADFLYQQEENSTQAVKEIPLIKEMAILFKDVFGINPAVRIILDSDVIMGEEFSLYRPLYDELREAIEDNNVLVETLLFLLIYSSDGVKDPISVFKENSDYLVSDLTVSTKLASILGEMYNKLTRQKELNSHEVV